LIDTALQLSGGDTRRVTVIHAVNSIEAIGALRNRARWMMPEYRGSVLDEARRQLNDMMPRSVGTDAKLQLRVAVGPAAETIGAHAADVN
jgi:hypothetical protein